MRAFLLALYIVGFLFLILFCTFSKCMCVYILIREDTKERETKISEAKRERKRARMNARKREKALKNIDQIILTV